MLKSRLIFGCGHLTGGATKSEAIALVRRCLDAGVTHFDTAPSYGIGTAEAVIGEALHNAGSGALVTAKVGSERPASPLLKSLLRKVKRAVFSHRAKSVSFQPAERPASGRFDLAFMEQSLSLSLERLQRARVDYLLLHETYGEDLTASVLGFLSRAVDGGIAGQVGSADSVPYEARTVECVPRGFVIQASIATPMLLSPADKPMHRLFLHSLITMNNALKAQDPRYARAADVVERKFRNLLEPDVMRIVLPYCLAAAHVPDAKFVYATSHRERLDSFLEAVETIERHDASDQIATYFRGAYSN